MKFYRYYKDYKDKIYNYLLYRVNFNKDIAEDLTSEVFIKALDKFDTFDKDLSFQAWIYKIAKNHLLNYYRVLGREVGIDENVKDKHSQKKAVELNLELERIFDKIRSMDSYFREVLTLRFIDGLNNKEIALVLEKDEGAVRTQVSRSLKKLREILEKEGQTYG